MPYGTLAIDSITPSANALSVTGSVSSVNTFGFKNRIINGGMVIDQRNAGASVTPTDPSYTLDRWKFRVSQTSKLTVQQNAGSVTPPTGYSNYLGVTSSSAYSLLSTDYFVIVQDIEGFNTADLSFGTANASTVTLSFQVRSSLTGTFSGSLRNSAANRSYPFSYTIAGANTWTSVSVTIAGDTSGTWIGATNGIGISVIFNLGCGSTYSSTANSWQTGNYTAVTGSTSVVSTNGATFYVTGVQFEKGTQATSFDFRSISNEYMLCYRYYYIARSTSDYTAFVNTRAYSTTNATGPFVLPVGMRAAPTLTVSTPYATYWLSYSITSIVIGQYTGDFRQLNLNATGAYTGASAAANIENGTGSGAGAYLAFSAEL